MLNNLLYLRNKQFKTTYYEEIFIFIGGVVTLTACNNEDVQPNETKELNKVVPGTNPKATGGSDGMMPYTIAGDYNSPWDINNLVPVHYYFNCYLSWDNIYVRVTPYIGLAYYDGADDGSYNTPTAGTFNLTTGNYPNLHTASHIEYGNYIAANPIVLEVNNDSAHELAIFSDWVTQGLNDHCPVMPSVYQYPFNWQPVYFDLVSNQRVQPVSVGDPDISPAPPVATPQEVQLLKDYGKVMYYKVEFGLGKNNYTDTVYVLALEDNGGFALPYQLYVTDTFGNDLYYHENPSNNSMEIVVDPQQLSATGVFNFVRSGEEITVSFLGADRKLRVVTSLSGGFVTLRVGY